MLDKIETLNKGLIVSCQALETEPLHSSHIMGRMAIAAVSSGAVGIRSNSPKDILEIKDVFSSMETDQEKGQARLFGSGEIERRAGKGVLHTTEQLREAS